MCVCQSHTDSHHPSPGTQAHFTLMPDLLLADVPELRGATDIGVLVQRTGVRSEGMEGGDPMSHCEAEPGAAPAFPSYQLPSWRTSEASLF